MPRLAIHLLGEPAIYFDGKPYRLPTPRLCVSVLAALAMRSQPIRRDALAAAFWPDDPEATALGKLRRHVHRIGQALPKIDDVDWIASDRIQIAWNEDADSWVDVRAFEEALADPARRNEALELYRGDLLESWYDEFFLADRERLRSLFITACFEAASDARRNLNFHEATGFAERILAMDEWREDALRLAITFRYEAGDRSSALAQYERFAKKLKTEIGVDPMPETLALRDVILTNGPLSPSTFKPIGVRETAAQTVRTPFVGRSAELAKLDAAWRHAARRRGTMLFVGGEPGIGKSRLVDEFAATTVSQGGRVLFGDTSNPQAYPYEPLVDALLRGLSLVAESPPKSPWLSVVAELLPELHATFPDLLPAESLDPVRARMRLFESLARTFESLARTRPLLLVLEDVHWAQAATLEALDAIARRIAALSILIVVTYRSSEVTAGHSLSKLRRRLQNDRAATSLELGPLLRSDFDELVGRPAHADRSEHLAELVYASSEGNPLFAGLLLQNYLERGVLPQSGVALPGMMQTILERSASLEEPARALVQTASVVGRSFTCELLSETLGWDQSDVLDAIGTLIDRGLVRASGSSAFSYTFAHALFETAIYFDLPEPQRAARHRRIAGVLEQMSDGDLHLLASVARHWRLAAEPARASEAYRAASSAALDVYARDEAIGWAHEGLAVECDPHKRFALLCLAIEAQKRSPSIDRWKGDIDELEIVARSLGDDERYVALQARQAFFAHAGERERESELIDEMLAVAERTDSDARRVAALDARGRLLTGIDAHAAIADFKAALMIAQRVDDRRSILDIRRHLISAYVRAGDLETGIKELETQRNECAIEGSIEDRLNLLSAESSIALMKETSTELERIGREMLEIATRIADRETQGRAHWLLGYAAANGSGDLATVSSEYEEAARLYEEIEQPQMIAAAYVNLGGYYTDFGLLDKATECYEKGGAFARRSGARNVVAITLANTAEICRLQGKFEEALALGREALEIALSTGDRNVVVGCTSVIGNTECALGLNAQGLEHLRYALEMQREWGAIESIVDALCNLIEALAPIGEREAVAGYAAELKALVPKAAERARTRIAAALAKAARLCGDAAQARLYQARGRDALTKRLATLPDEESRSAFANLPFNRELME